MKEPIFTIEELGVVHPKCIIGEKCTIFQHVTLGSKWSGGINEGGAPVKIKTSTVGYRHFMNIFYRAN